MNKSVVGGIVSAVVLLILSVFGESILPLLMLAALVWIVIVSVLLNRAFVSALDVSIALDSLSEQGKMFSGKLSVRNSSRWYFPILRVGVVIENLFTGESETRDIPFGVPGRGSVVSDLHIHLAHCGKMRVTVKRLTVYDYFGMVALSVPKKLSQDAIVLPEIFPLDVTVGKSGVAESE